jgi:hypothetical protein
MLYGLYPPCHIFPILQMSKNLECGLRPSSFFTLSPLIVADSLSHQDLARDAPFGLAEIPEPIAFLRRC